MTENFSCDVVPLLIVLSAERCVYFGESKTCGVQFLHCLVDLNPICLVLDSVYVMEDETFDLAV
jgi:hypothetical protein